MVTLTGFFKGSDSTLGVFYPAGYIIANFPTFALAEGACHALRQTGLAEDEVLAIPANEVLKFFEEFRAHSGLWAGVMAMLSRAFGTEQVFADDDVRRAESGQGFLAIHSPGEAQAHHVRELLIPFQPHTMHWYRAGGVENLI